MPQAPQDALDKTLVSHDTTKPGTGISWVQFSRGSHMSIGKYGYLLDAPLAWLVSQNWQSEVARGKLAQLQKPWLGREARGQVRAGSGTAGPNPAQFTPMVPASSTATRASILWRLPLPP